MVAYRRPVARTNDDDDQMMIRYTTKHYSNHHHYIIIQNLTADPWQGSGGPVTKAVESGEPRSVRSLRIIIIIIVIIIIIKNHMMARCW